MGFVTNAMSAIVKIVLVPIAVIKDGLAIANKDEPDNTKTLLEGVVSDARDSVEDLFDGDLF